jgi:hypothetical protein
MFGISDNYVKLEKLKLNSFSNSGFEGDVLNFIFFFLSLFSWLKNNEFWFLLFPFFLYKKINFIYFFL